MSEQGFTVDRRVTLKWLFGAIAASGVPLQGAYAAAAPAPWPVGTPAKIDAPGYGTDPKMLEPVVPWPKTAPSAVGIEHFIDEWVSAPYPDQAADRAILLAGFEWVEAEAKARHGKGYAALDEGPRATILSDAARGGGRLFLDRMKFLTTGAYYTSEAGIEELGYIGNTALDGDYPGPTPEAFAHLDRVLATLNLKR
ncbi:MAG: gluconate 2-dehydrogenase subunit 3 family protein [Alphaproteobacteria bacterium]|nr:MAG: gluconate 2-dehydrogenase subunit 3 family protein [Alphaproteobacteria bacterium]